MRTQKDKLECTGSNWQSEQHLKSAFTFTEKRAQAEYFHKKKH